MPPLSSEEREALRESMLNLGYQLEPIAVAPDMTILNGHNRWEIAREIGWSELAYIVVDVPVHLQVDYMIRTAVERRQLAGPVWHELVTKLRSDGWSNRRIAEATGKSKSAVHRLAAQVSHPGTPAEVPAAPTRVTGKDGKSYAAKAPVAPRRTPTGSGGRCIDAPRTRAASAPDAAASSQKASQCGDARYSSAT